MRKTIPTTDRPEDLTKLILISIFALAFVLFASLVWNQTDGLANFHPSTLELAMLGFATFRLGRLAAFDRVMEPLRRPFTRTIPDPTGAGETVVPAGSGVRKAIGELVSCPICAGTWIAAVLTVCLYLYPGPTRVFLVMSATIGLAELLHNTAESLNWSAELSRSRSGQIARAQRQQANISRLSSECDEDQAGGPEAGERPGFLSFSNWPEKENQIKGRK